MSVLKTADIEEEYKKNKQLKKEDVKLVMEWLQKQPHLPKLTELKIIIFLHSCYFKIEATKTTIDNYFTMKTAFPEMFGDMNPLKSPLKETIETLLFVTLSQQTPEGYSILFIKVLNSDPDLYNFSLATKYFLMSNLLHLYQNGTANGCIIIFDFKGVVFGHLTKLGPVTMKRCFVFLQEALPNRLKAFHFFNIVPFMDKIVVLMKPFMRKDIFDVLYLHNTVDDLSKFVPKKCLPQEYGGLDKNTMILHEQHKRNLVENYPFFEYENSLVVDESKRVEKLQNFGDYLGMDGTFKKLEID